MTRFLPKSLFGQTLVILLLGLVRRALDGRKKASFSLRPCDCR